MSQQKISEHQRHDPEKLPNVCYLVVSVDGALVPIKSHKAMSIWSCQGSIAGLPVNPDLDLTIITVMRRGLQPVCGWVMRLPVRNKRITVEAVQNACHDSIELMPKKIKQKSIAARRRAKDKIGWHKAMLPKDTTKQLAVYFDAPHVHFDTIDIGGPLPLASSCRMTIDECIKHLCEETN